MGQDALSIARSVYGKLASMSPEAAPRVRAWEGTEFGPADAASTVVLKTPGALRALMLPPSDLRAGEAYLDDDVDIEGDVIALLEWAAGLETLRRKPLTAWRLARQLRRLPAERGSDRAGRPSFSGRLHSLRRDREAVSYHYDTGNDFYSLFLGDTMAYSCAYFLDPAEPLDTAQRRKLDVICRKLELTPGTSFLDIGCGWGSLAVHAATNYGADVTAVTISEEQAAYARRWAKEAGVGDRVNVIRADYREIGGRYDAIASIGMHEHVGRAKLPEYFSHVHELMAPGGQFLNHGITTRDRHRSRRKPKTFVSTYVFPDGELVPIDHVVGAAEEQGFEVRDLESLRMSYAQTLRRWVTALEEHHDDAVEATSERTYRIWRVYMAGSSVAFARGGIGVYQSILSDPARPWRFGRSRLIAKDDT